MNRKFIEALLLIGPNCPYCATMMQLFNEIIKQGQLGKLEIINIEVQPELAVDLGVRSVPWLRIGGFEFEGILDQAEIVHWIKQVGETNGMANYFEYLLGKAQLAKALNIINSHPIYLQDLLILVEDTERRIDVRLGVGAVFEELQNSGLLYDLVEKLALLTRNPVASVRADAAHYLSLTQNQQAIPHLQALLHDANAEVRDIAAESIMALQ